MKKNGEYKGESWCSISFKFGQITCYVFFFDKNEKCIRLGGIYKGFSFERLMNVFAKKDPNIWLPLVILVHYVIIIYFSYLWSIACFLMWQTNPHNQTLPLFVFLFVRMCPNQCMSGGFQPCFQPYSNNENWLT